MDLGTILDLDIVEIGLAASVICEAEAAPRLTFQYPNYQIDPKPDILMLGGYKHPNTGNELVGGINLNYLSKSQVSNLRKVLPKIMGGGNLQARYNIGKKLAPDVFNNFYRTYNSRFIRSVKKDAIYPKYGFTKNAIDWVKRQASKLYKSKDERDKADQPEFPTDLRDLPSKIDVAIQKAQDVATAGTQPDPIINKNRDNRTDQMDLARSNFNKLQRDKLKSSIDKIPSRSVDRAPQQAEPTVQKRPSIDSRSEEPQPIGPRNNLDWRNAENPSLGRDSRGIDQRSGGGTVDSPDSQRYEKEEDDLDEYSR